MKNRIIKKSLSILLVIGIITSLMIPSVSAVEARSSASISTNLASGGHWSRNVTKSAGTTLTVSFSNSTSDTDDPCQISITCTDSSGGIETKAMYSGTRQFFNKPAGTTNIYLYNDGFYTASLSGSIHYT